MLLHFWCVFSFHFVFWITPSIAQGNAWALLGVPPLKKVDIQRVIEWYLYLPSYIFFSAGGSKPNIFRNLYFSVIKFLEVRHILVLWLRITPGIILGYKYFGDISILGNLSIFCTSRNRNGSVLYKASTLPLHCSEFLVQFFFS